MRARRSAWVVAAMLLVVGCSAESAPTTVGGTTTTRGGITGFESGGPVAAQARVIAGISRCPSKPEASDKGVHGLGGKLVPIDASTVRICAYTGRYEAENGGLAVLPVPPVEFRLLRLPAAARFENETNQLPKGQRGAGECAGPMSGIASGTVLTAPRYFAVTFANEFHRVEVDSDAAPCSGGQLSNGHFFADATTKWLRTVKGILAPQHP